VVDGFPVSDGFFVSTSPISPGGVPLERSPFNAHFRLGYDGSTLSSLDIVDAIGSYDFTGLTVFGFNLWAVSPDNVAMEIDFAQMTIEAAPANGSDDIVPASSPKSMILLVTLLLIGSGGLIVRRSLM
jgi:hypothetical protein